MIDYKVTQARGSKQWIDENVALKYLVKAERWDCVRVDKAGTCAAVLTTAEQDLLLTNGAPVVKLLKKGGAKDVFAMKEGEIFQISTNI